MTKTAPAIFLIMHEVVFRPVPLFVHVSSWGIPSGFSVELLKVSTNLSKGWEKIEAVCVVQRQVEEQDVIWSEFLHLEPVANVVLKKYSHI